MLAARTHTHTQSHTRTLTMTIIWHRFSVPFFIALRKPHFGRAHSADSVSKFYARRSHQTNQLNRRRRRSATNAAVQFKNLWRRYFSLTLFVRRHLMLASSMGTKRHAHIGFKTIPIAEFDSSFFFSFHPSASPMRRGRESRELVRFKRPTNSEETKIYSMNLTFCRCNV